MPTREQRELIQNVLRQRQSDGLALFRALDPSIPGIPDTAPNQVELISCQATEVMYRGGNRSGKSTAGSIRFACAARDLPFYDWSGNKHYVRPQYQRGKPLTMWVIGLQLNHIGQTIHRLLFEPGLYQIIKDEDTGLWRPFREWEESERRDECQPSPPLIPKSEISEISWSRAAAREFDAVHLHNGTSIYAYASTSDVKQGDAVDWIWIDERIAFPGHYDEWRARLIDKRGKMFWTSKPFAGNRAMFDLSAKARKQQEEVEFGERKPEDVHVIEFILKTSNNPTLSEDSMREFRESLSAEALAVRDAGEYEISNALIYPYFSNVTHNAIPANPEFDDEISRILRDNNGIAPNNWCHEFILDPGTYKPAVLFGAVPPPDLWPDDHPVCIVYDEIFGRGRKLDAYKLMQIVKEKTPPGRVYNKAVIDGHAGRQTSMGAIVRVDQLYWKAMKHSRIPTSDNCRFWVEGSDNFRARKMIVDEHLMLRNNGQPALRIAIQRCPFLTKQLTENHFQIDSIGNVNDEKPASRQEDDLRDCLEYWLSTKPTYVAPPASGNLSVDLWKRHQRFIDERFRKQKPENSTISIGGATLV